MKDRHFDKVFWFISAAVGFVLIYIMAITFIPIPKENIRFADTALSFLMGSVIGACISYLVGGNPAQSKKNNTEA